VNYLNEVGKEIKGPIRVGGHSKGGNFAVYAAAFCDREIQDRIVAVYTNDGPGFRSEVMEREAYKRILPKVVSIVPDTAIVGVLLTSNVGHIVVKSKEAGLMQHDALTWMVEQNRFKQTKQSAIGSLIDSSQKEWLSNIDDETREMFVNTLFSLFESTGMETFDEMVVNRRISAKKIMASIKSLPKDKQEEMKAVMNGLLQSFRNVVGRHFGNRRNGERPKVLDLFLKYTHNPFHRQRSEE
jgi:hypothetical protein